jgi:thiosulfate dehydrogenase
MMGRFLLGTIVGLLLAPAVMLAWFRFGNPPVAVADTPLPREKSFTIVPLEERIHREMPAGAPFAADEQTLVAGAVIYQNQCAACHGFQGKPSSFGAHMFPDAPPLWERHHNGEVVGVSDDPVGETYWKIANGIRLSGMPAYKQILTSTEIWQVALLLANADKPMPPKVLDSVRGIEPSPPAPGPAVTRP